MDFRLTNTDGLGNMFAISGPTTKGSPVHDSAAERTDSHDIFEAVIEDGEAQEGATYRFEDEQGEVRLVEVLNVTTQVEDGREVTRVRARLLAA